MCWPDYRATICNLHDHDCWTSWICVRCFLRLQLPAQQFTMHLLEQTWSRLDLGATLSGNAAGTVLSCTISWCLWSSVRVLARANHRCMSKLIFSWSVGSNLQVKVPPHRAFQRGPWPPWRRETQGATWPKCMLSSEESQVMATYREDVRWTMRPGRWISLHLSFSSLRMGDALCLRMKIALPVVLFLSVAGSPETDPHFCHSIYLRREETCPETDLRNTPGATSWAEHVVLRHTHSFVEDSTWLSRDKGTFPEDQLSKKGVELNSWSQHWSSNVFNWVHPHFGAVETSLTNERPMARHQCSCAMVCVPLWPMRVPLPGTFLCQCRKLRDSCSQWLCWICLEPTSLDADVPDTTP